MLCYVFRVVKGMVNFGEFKSCVLASLRSLPMDWSAFWQEL